MTRQTTKRLVIAAIAIAAAASWVLLARLKSDAVGATEALQSSDREAREPAPTAVALDAESPAAEARPSRRPDASVVATAVASVAEPAAPVAPQAALDLQRIVGRVVDVDRREPVADCSVELVQGGATSGVLRTDARGRFESPALFATGIVEVRTQSAWLSRPDSPWTIAPTRIWLESRPAEVELIATPAIEIAVEVRRSDGPPAALANVFATLAANPEWNGDAEATDDCASSFTAICDAAGRTTFWLERDRLGPCALYLSALGMGGTGKLDAIAPPLPAMPLVIVIDHGTPLRVRVLDMHKQPLADATVNVSQSGGGNSNFGWAQQTDSAGIAPFDGIPRGIVDITVTDRTNERSAARQLEVTGSNDEIEIVLEDSKMRLAVRGVVLDESGGPVLGVDVHVQSPNIDQHVQTTADGSFQVLALPSKEIAVHVGPNPLDDVFEPTRTSVPFGTTDFVARRVRSPDHWKLEIRIVDRTTQRLLPHSCVLTSLRSSTESMPWFTSDGLASVTVTDRPDACVMFWAVGYKPIIRECSELLPPHRPSGYLTIEMEPGFEQRITFVDTETSAPIANVAMVQPSGAVVRSDATGNVMLEASDWPERYRIDCAGYYSIDWDPREGPLWNGVFRMEKMLR